MAWKGFHLGLMAFAKSGLESAEYWIIGDGPERKRLEALARRLGVAERVRFFGKLPREDVLRLLAQAHALVHPSLHDSGGWVCLEAMAAGRPVICLELGGAATQVTEETGFKGSAGSPEQAVEDMARAMLRLAQDPDLCQRMGHAAQRRVWEAFSWVRRAKQMLTRYEEVLRRER